MADKSMYPRAGDRSPSACAQREEHWRRVLARWEQSGLTRAAFCRRDGIQESALSWWARELSERSRSRRGVRKASQPKRAQRPAFVPVRVIQAVPRPSASAVEVVTRGGLIVRLQPDFDPATLRKVLAALEGQPC
ncbi:MAG: IS66 family insertion sequence element accessory protein TnpA [Burkholderiales bacterium]